MGGKSGAERRILTTVIEEVGLSATWILTVKATLLVRIKVAYATHTS